MSIMELLGNAEAATGLSDWGGLEFIEGLTVVRGSVVKESQTGKAGLEAFDDMATSILVKRLKVIDDRTRHPEISREEIRSPLIVVGLPRTGTTILHALLAQASNARSPLDWEIDEPSPPPRQASYNSDPRIARRKAVVDVIGPAMRTYHIMDAQLPDECDVLLQYAFQTFRLNANFYTPRYMEWLLQTDTSPGYDFHRQMLQHLGAFTDDKQWVLKSPTHIFWLDRLLATYPDARIVFTHRDPADVVPSTASFYCFVRRNAGSVAEPRRVGREQLDLWSAGIRRAMQYRSENPHREKQFFDVHYREMNSDPVAVVREIYRHFGMPFYDVTEQAMQRFMAENQQGKHGTHKYSLEQFGLDKASLDEEFGEYLQAYNIPNSANA